MPRVQLQVNGEPVNDRLADVSTEFPDAEFSILAALPTDDGLLDIVEITTLDGDTVVRHFENASEVRSFEVIHTDEQRVLLQFVIPVSETYAALLTSGIVPQQPVSLKDGWYSAGITASHERLSAYTAELAAAGLPYQIMSVTQSFDSSELLTERQWEFVTAAIEHGFYDTPRDCTLTDLAAVLDVKVSAMSRLRHRAESRIITAFVAETAP